MATIAMTKSTPKAGPTDATIDEFWNWFRSVSADFGEKFENRSLIGQLDQQIARLGDFSWEIGPAADDSASSSLVISPSGEPDLLHQTRHIISRAPQCDGWKFYPALPPKRWDFTILLHRDEGDAILVKADNWRYVLLRVSDDIFDIVVCPDDGTPLDELQLQVACEILVQGSLGEEVVMEHIHQIETIRRFTSKMAPMSGCVVVLSRHLESLTAK